MTTLDDLKQLIHEVFAIDPATLDPNTPLSEYGLDSLSLVELIFSIEERFDIDLPDSGQDVSSLAALAALIDDLKVATVR